MKSHARLELNKANVISGRIMKKALCMSVLVLAATLANWMSTAQAADGAKITLSVTKFPVAAEQVAWLGYGLGLQKYVSENNLQESSPLGPWVPTFEAEVFARQNQTEIWKEIRAKKDISYSFMEQMERVIGADFLREYVWMYYQQSEWSKP